MTLEDIGEGEKDALLCNTNLTACCRPPYSGSTNGNWYFPNGSSRIPSRGNLHSTFYRTRGQMVVRLNHRRGGEEGIYRCEIPDSVNVVQNIYIGLYTTNTSIGE